MKSNLRKIFNTGKKGQGEEASLGKGYGKDCHLTLTQDTRWLPNLHPFQYKFSYKRLFQCWFKYHSFVSNDPDISGLIGWLLSLTFKHNCIQVAQFGVII